MKKYLPLFIALAIGITSCTSECEAKGEEDPDLNTTEAAYIKHDTVQLALIHPNKFRFKNMKFFSPSAIDKSDAVKIDSIFHQTILSQIDAYNLSYSQENNNYFISVQDKIYDFNCVIVSLYYGVCYEGVFLLLIDNNSVLKNYFPVTEIYSSCDYTTETITEFMTNNTFKMSKTTTEPGLQDLITELEFIGKINPSGKTDTIKILRSIQYEN